MNLIMRLFPGAWRARYEAEFLALLDDQPRGRRRWWDIARCLVAAHLDRKAPPSLGPTPLAGRALIAAVVVLTVAVAALGAVFVGTASQSALRKAAELVRPLLVILPVALAAAFVWSARRHAERSLRSAIRTVIVDAFVLAVVGIVLVATLTPQLGFFEQPPIVELIPFHDVVNAASAATKTEAIADLAGNGLLFLMLGFALALQRGRLGAAPVLTMAIGFAFVIEIAQALFGTGRPADSTDIVVRAIGTAIGYGVWRAASAGATLRRSAASA